MTSKQNCGPTVVGTAYLRNERRRARRLELRLDKQVAVQARAEAKLRGFKNLQDWLVHLVADEVAKPNAPTFSTCRVAYDGAKWKQILIPCITPEERAIATTLGRTAARMQRKMLGTLRETTPISCSSFGELTIRPAIERLGITGAGVHEFAAIAIASYEDASQGVVVRSLGDGQRGLVAHALGDVG